MLITNHKDSLTWQPCPPGSRPAYSAVGRNTNCSQPTGLPMGMSFMGTTGPEDMYMRLCLFLRVYDHQVHLSICQGLLF